MTWRAEWDKTEWEEALQRISYLLGNSDSAADVRSEFSPAALLKALGAMLVSRHKYGLLAAAYPQNVDALASLDLRLKLYRDGDESMEVEAGNVEYLVDVMNFAMIEFMRPRHPSAHYKGTDKYGSPGRVMAGANLQEVLGVNQHTNADIAAVAEG